MESYAKGDEAIAPAIEQSKELLKELEELNPKTGITSGIIGKLLGLHLLLLKPQVLHY